MNVEGETVTQIDIKATEVLFPPNVRLIDQFACFEGHLSSLDLQNTRIQIIGSFSFYHCMNLQNILFPTSLEEICEGAFYGCCKLESIDIPSDSKLIKIGPKAFKYCRQLEGFRSPPLLQYIGDNAFQYCTKLYFTRTNVCKIGNHAFKDTNHNLFIRDSPIGKFNIIGDEYIAYNNKYIINNNNGSYFMNRVFFKGTPRKKYFFLRRGIEIIANNCFSYSKLVYITIPASVKIISRNAFGMCTYLKKITFSGNSKLIEIQNKAFFYCCHMKKFVFPKSLQIIRSDAFVNCIELEKVVFPFDSQLIRIENAFLGTRIKYLSLPPSIQEIVDLCFQNKGLESIYVKNEKYESNSDGTAIFSKDMTELVCVLYSLERFKIPDGVRVIKRGAFLGYTFKCLQIPSSVEIIEDEALMECKDKKIIEFAPGSRLKSLGYMSFPCLDDLIIDGENFVKLKNGVVMSLSPRGIIFVPGHLRELDIDPGIEFVYHFAFSESKIQYLSFPKSLKRITSKAFYKSDLMAIEFEEGTELDYIGDDAFDLSKIWYINLPPVKEYFSYDSFKENVYKIQFPPKFQPKRIKDELIDCNIRHVICPKSSISVLSHLDLNEIATIDIIGN